MSLDNKITNAQHRIEELWNETDGKCYTSFSGGKDSTVLLALVKMCQELGTVGDIPAVFINTGIELGVTVDFVKWCRESGWYKNIQIIRPPVSFDQTLKLYGKPMKSKMKSELLGRWHNGKRTAYVKGSLIDGVLPTGTRTFRSKIGDRDMHMIHDDFPIKAANKCCEAMKKHPIAEYEQHNDIKGSLLGMRTAEGGVRKIVLDTSKKKTGKVCTYYSKNGVIRKSPIVDWNDEDLAEFIETHNVPLSDAYTKYGFQRTGCMGCPFSQNLPSDLKYLYDHEPNRYRAAMHWLKDVYIAQNVMLPFDEAYEREREREWRDKYEPMRQEMLRKYRPNSRLIKDDEQMTIFDYLKNEQEK